MSTTATSCPSCGSGNEDTHPDLEATHRVAAEIVRGSDLGGIFELASELAKGRCDVGISADPKGLAATRAAVHVREAFNRVRREFEQLEGPKQRQCRLCRLRRMLAHLTTCASEAVSAQTFWETELRDACKELAHYAGDDEHEAAATRAVLELAANVFLKALAVTSPELFS
jgi:hypothetical protein